MIKALRAPRFLGELGRAMTAVADWAENVRAEGLARFVVRPAPGTALPGDLVSVGGEATRLTAAAEANRGSLILVCARSASNVTYGTTTVSVTGAVLFASDGSRWWPVTGRAT